MNNNKLKEVITVKTACPVYIAEPNITIQKKQYAR